VRLDVIECGSAESDGGRELKRIVFDEETIAERVQSLGREITRPTRWRSAGPGPSQGSFIFLRISCDGSIGRCRSILSSHRATAKDGVERERPARV